MASQQTKELQKVVDIICEGFRASLTVAQLRAMFPTLPGGSVSKFDSSFLTDDNLLTYWVRIGITPEDLMASLPEVIINCQDRAVKVQRPRGYLKTAVVRGRGEPVGATHSGNTAAPTPAAPELTQKDAELTQKDAELTQKDAARTLELAQKDAERGPCAAGVQASSSSGASSSSSTPHDAYTEIAKSCCIAMVLMRDYEGLERTRAMAAGFVDAYFNVTPAHTHASLPYQEGVNHAGLLMRRYGGGQHPVVKSELQRLAAMRAVAEQQQHQCVTCVTPRRA
jgi:hypothetical protein